MAEPTIGPGGDAGTDDFRVSTDRSDVDLDWVHDALANRAYCALGRTREQIARSIVGSVPYVALRGGRQVGFARVVTDGATFGWVCDVFVDEAERGRGVGKALVRAIVADPRLAGVRLVLATRDAFGLYEGVGFGPLANPERWMERRFTG